VDDIEGLPFWQLRFDKDGNSDAGRERFISDELRASSISDLLVFCHGWNNDFPIAKDLYQKFFSLVPPLLVGRIKPQRKVGLLGIFWPSMRWPDEPIPDFAAVSPVPDLGAGEGGSASSFELPLFPAPPPPGTETKRVVLEAFPGSNPADVDELIHLMMTRPDNAASLRRSHAIIASLAASSTPDLLPGDGEGAGQVPAMAEPGRDPAEVYTAFQQALEDSGIETSEAAGAAGLDRTITGLWHGGQEVLRQVTYWQMKKRAGIIGANGLGPFIRRLNAAFPDLGVNLIGHSFGARAVSFSLRALPVGGSTGVRSVTLLQGAFSHFAFAEALPFDPGRSGLLKDMQSKVDGPIIACHSRYDSAVGTFYPLASLAAGQDAADFTNPLFRWQAIGHDGHQPSAQLLSLRQGGQAYAIEGVTLGNIDASSIVRHGSPPSGAHSDIFHEELAWIPLCAGGLVTA